MATALYTNIHIARNLQVDGHLHVFVDQLEVLFGGVLDDFGVQVCKVKAYGLGLYSF